MSKEEILENNILIARFMNCQRWPDRDGYVTKFGNINSAVTTSEQLRFHKEWDWIMPVIEKITSFCRDNAYTEDINNEWSEFFDYQSYNLFSGKIVPVYDAIIKFIKFYNQNKLNETN